LGKIVARALAALRFRCGRIADHFLVRYAYMYYEDLEFVFAFG
jgi:hypothetical protein